MRSLVAVAALIAAFSFAAGSSERWNGEPWPTTVGEAVNRLLARQSPEDLEWIRTNPREVVTSELHLPYGTGVRNEFGLWGKNQKLLASCGTDHAEGCSSVIFSALWDKVREGTDPDRARMLDCHFAALDRIQIDTTGWYRLRLGEVLASLQQQIDKQVTSTIACDGPIRVVAIGNPNLQCFVRAEFEHTDSLGSLFQWLGFRNAFSASNAPPIINLDFREKCAWPEQPKYFVPEGKG